MLKEEHFDIIIIGAGPIGIACALECKKRNWNYLVVEKGALTNSLFNYPKNMTFFSTSEKLEINAIPFISNNPKPNRDEALEYYRRVTTSNQLNIRLFETVDRIEKANENFTIKTDKATYHSKKTIVCTGFYDIPKLLNVPGEHLEKVTHYYKEAHNYALQNVMVVGASNSAVDAALEVWRKGGHVTMVIRGKEIGDRVKYWVRPDIINRIKEGSITAYFNTEITEIKQNEVIIKHDNEDVAIPNDFVIALTGYLPNFELLKNSGITLSSDGKNIPQYNPKTMESNVKGFYLAGVVCGGKETHKWFIENSRIHAKLIAEHIEKSKF
ncbi:YpdA family putative bacillithiol disulfide reductase [Tamlana sp. 2_MG-2023]|uniref:YpdA family putative bacillithiol disulfide reductase n=1 Tax=unclassified Tamlana TaxID=2614803 RepID=UPI0026E30CC4|nr:MULTISPECIES: YpdA family putative bacillithiol disulfide reductase [unclassified Tamlana]MDO6759029.1 YpdA family putative bacillithiol disulfide reductase [Tamlana sp. 2_MG-2023]MDO6789728.1 YpdA family putative bacillithiol disulfide reductase [Tamlana sp. 1_MG-2023]